MDINLYKLLLSLSLILGVILLRWLLITLISKFVADHKALYNSRKIIIYLSNILIIIVIILVWIHEFESAVTFLGLLTAGLAIALKDPIVNFFGWIFILVNRPFEMGDRIEIENKAGDVLDISFFKFTVIEIGGAWVDANQSTGRIIHIPNGKVFTASITNFAQGFQQIWNEIPVIITFQSNWQKAKEILLEIEQSRVGDWGEIARKEIDKSKKRFNIHYKNLTPGEAP